MRYYLISNIILSSQLSKKIDKINQAFSSFVDKYIGDGLGASVIVLLFVILAVLLVGKFAKK